MRPNTRTTMKFASIMLKTILTLLATSTTVSVSAIQIDKDGGYTDIVVKISSSVPEESCPKILTNIKVKTTHKFYFCLIISSHCIN